MAVKQTDIQFVSNDCEDCEYKLDRQRWFILSLFCFYSFTSFTQMVMYGFITDKLVVLYGVSPGVAKYTVYIFFIVNVIAGLPFSILINKLGLLWAIRIGMCGTCIGAWLKLLSVEPTKFWVLLLSQGIAAIASIPYFALPSKLTAVWFANNELATACGIATIIPQGLSFIGLLLPSLVFQESSIEIKDLEYGFKVIAYFFTAFSTIGWILILLFFSEAPPTCPSKAESKIEVKKFFAKDVLKSIKRLVTNRSFMMLQILVEFTSGSYVVISVTLNQVYLNHFPGSANDVSYIATSSMIFGVVASIGFGMILDKYHWHKLLNVITTGVYTLIVTSYLISINLNKTCTYITAIAAGTVGMTLLPLAYEVSMELTYPEPQDVCGSLMNVICFLISTFDVTLYDYLLDNYGEVIANFTLMATLILSMFLFSLINFDLKRNKAETEDEGVFKITNF